LAALGFYVSLISISSELVPPLFSFLGDGHAKLASPIWKTWKALEHKRTLVVHFASVERLDEFNLYWRSHEIHLFGKLDNSSLLLACPSLDIPEVMEQIIRHNKWTLVGAYAHQHPLAYGDMLRYQTPNNVDVFFQPIVITFPRYFMRRRKKMEGYLFVVFLPQIRIPFISITYHNSGPPSVRIRAKVRVSTRSVQIIITMIPLIMIRVLRELRLKSIRIAPAISSKIPTLCSCSQDFKECLCYLDPPRRGGWAMHVHA
jgi:hypothetical protein